MWPGYEVKTKQCTAGIFLNVDACTKFVRETTVLEDINDRYQSGERLKDIFEEFNSSNTD